MEAGEEQQKVRAAQEKRAMMGKLADDFDASVGSILETVAPASSEFELTVQSMASISEETSNQALAADDQGQGIRVPGSRRLIGWRPPISSRSNPAKQNGRTMLSDRLQLKLC